MNWRGPALKALLQAEAALNGRLRGVNQFYGELLELEFASPEALARRAERALSDLLLHCYKHVPYYRPLLAEAGVVRDGRARPERLAQMPTLTKDIIRRCGDDLLSDERRHRRTYANTSGGSTGEPVEFLQDDVYLAWNRATALFYNHVAGKEPGQREVKLWGSERDILTGSIGLRAKAENFFYNRLLLNSFMMAPETMSAYVAAINRFRPRSIWAYVQSADELARHAESEGLRIEPVPVTILTAGTLTQPVRETVERVFGTRVHNQYASRETGPMACECPQRGLHVFERTTLIEVVDADGRPVPDGQSGELCVTLLTNFTMPLVRYRIGDVAALATERCPCGRPMRLLRAVTGRIIEHFVRRDGTLVDGAFFLHVFYHRPWVLSYQVVQEDYDHVVGNVVARGRPDEGEREEMTRAIRAAMGEQCRVEFRFVESIPPSPSGKRLYMYSKVRR